MKRQSAVAAGSAAKKQKCDLVSEGLRRSTGYPTNVVEMLSSGLLNSLGVDKENRHPFQDQIIGNVGEILSSVVTGLEKTIADAQSKVESASDETKNREAKLETATHDLTSKTEAMDAAQAALEESSQAVKAAATSVTQAEKNQKQGLTELDKKQQQKKKFEVVLNDALIPLIESEPEEKSKKSFITLVVKVGSELALDPSMLAAIPHTLSLSLSSRGTFDNLVCDQIRDELGKQIKAIDDAIAEGEGARSEAASKTEAAKEALEAARAQETQRKDSSEQSNADYLIAKADYKAATKAVSTFGPEIKQTSSDLDNAKAELQGFSDGAMAVYKELLESSAAAAVTEAAA